VTPAPAAALALAAGLAVSACGVKAPPRPSGAPDKAPPHDLFRPVEDPNRPRLELEKPAQEPAQEPAR
jgi:hypothetical protein